MYEAEARQHTLENNSSVYKHELKTNYIGVQNI